MKASETFGAKQTTERQSARFAVNRQESIGSVAKKKEESPKP
jgi:hypothetical protein